MSANQRSVANLKRSTLVAMLEQYLEEDAQLKAELGDSYKTYTTVELAAMFKSEFGINLRPAEQFEGEDDFEQV